VRADQPTVTSTVHFGIAIIHRTQYLALEHVREDIGSTMMVWRCRPAGRIGHDERDDSPCRVVGKLVLVGYLSLDCSGAVVGTFSD